MVIGLCGFRGSWLRYWVFRSYYGSRLNWRFFWKFTTHVIRKVNTLSFFHGYVIRRWLIMSWKARVIDRCDFLSLWFRYTVSGSYHSSHPNRRIFRKFATLVVLGVNNLSRPGGYVTRVM